MLTGALHVDFMLETITLSLFVALLDFPEDFPEMESFILALSLHLIPHVLMKLISLLIQERFEIVSLLVDLQVR